MFSRRFMGSIRVYNFFTIILLLFDNSNGKIWLNIRRGE